MNPSLWEGKDRKSWSVHGREAGDRMGADRMDTRARLLSFIARGASTWFPRRFLNCYLLESKLMLFAASKLLRDEVAVMEEKSGRWTTKSY